MIEVVTIDRLGGEEIVGGIGIYGEGAVDDGEGERDLRNLLRVIEGDFLDWVSG